MLKVWGAYSNTDKTEGRGGMQLDGLFTKEEDAKKRAKGQGVMGYGDGNVKEVHIFESYEEYRDITDKERRAKLRRSAMAKLTTQEKLVLGLKP